MSYFTALLESSPLGTRHPTGASTLAGRSTGKPPPSLRASTLDLLIRSRVLKGFATFSQQTFLYKKVFTTCSDNKVSTFILTDLSSWVFGQCDTRKGTLQVLYGFAHSKSPQKRNR